MALALQEFSVTFKYRAGRANVAADCLSRLRLVVDTSGEFSCGNERIIGVAVRSVRAVGSLYVTVLGSAAYIGARYLVTVWRGSRRDLTRLKRLL